MKELFKQNITANAKHGFTLVELIVAISAFGFLAVGVIALVSSVMVGSDSQGRSLSNLEQARRFSFEFVNGVRSATFSDTGAYPLQTAENTEIVIFYNFDGGSDTERVRYFLSGTDLARGVVKPSGVPLTYDIDEEEVAVLVKDVQNGGSPIFSYYNGSYVGDDSSPLSLPVTLTSVRYIALNMDIKKDYSPQSTSVYNVRTGASLRNIKDNLND